MKFIREKEVAEMLSISVATLRRMRLRRQGIPYSKVGASVLYNVEAVESYVASCQQGGYRRCE